MRIVRVAVLCAAVVVVGLVLVSGTEDSGSKTPAALPGLPAPFVGTAVVGEGGLIASIDAYGDVVDLRAGPAGEALIDNPSDRQAAGTVPARTGIVPRMAVRDSPPLPIWRAESVTQHYLRDSNVVETVAYIKEARVWVRVAAAGDSLALEMVTGSSRQGRGLPAISVQVEDGIHCAHAKHGDVLDLLCRVGRALPVLDEEGNSREVFRECDRIIHGAVGAGRRWSRKARDLGAGAPGWAREMYRRSLLTLHALTSQRTGAVAAGARDGWAYVWPRDAATAALALQASGHHADARRVVRFLKTLDLTTAARFDEEGAAIPGRAAQGDASGWVAAAAAATGLEARRLHAPWRDRADYQESSPGTYLGNALAATATLDVDGPKSALHQRFSAHQRRVAREFGTVDGLVRRAGDPGSGLDSAAGWAVRPFEIRPLYPAAEKTLLRLAEGGTPYGITPGEGWEGGEDPWTAPTAWSAWALAGLAAEGRGAADRRAALGLLADLRRASTSAGSLPERVGVHTGIPTSTTPLLWSSAFTVLALRELWP
ncbi:MAG TPA: glycoside hydrolase family 15 protein [Solirubrobacterales bacterium]|nr:glycoside hydrolase family 15 protein [Solirubrobacterales bacterium]